MGIESRHGISIPRSLGIKKTHQNRLVPAQLERVEPCGCGPVQNAAMPCSQGHTPDILRLLAPGAFPQTVLNSRLYFASSSLEKQESYAVRIVYPYSKKKEPKKKKCQRKEKENNVHWCPSPPRISRSSSARFHTQYIISLG